ncbi:unnamed protein product [Heterobilharzia americana]|nr:unnamed protein product [Heterobilharzia americana]
MFRTTYYIFVIAFISILVKSCYAGFIVTAWNSFIQRVISGEFWFDLYLTLYRWLRSCILDFSNLKELFFPKRFYEQKPFDLLSLLKLL